MRTSGKDAGVEELEDDDDDDEEDDDDDEEDDEDVDDDDDDEEDEEDDEDVDDDDDDEEDEEEGEFAADTSLNLASAGRTKRRLRMLGLTWLNDKLCVPVTMRVCALAVRSSKCSKKRSKP